MLLFLLPIPARNSTRLTGSPGGSWHSRLQLPLLLTKAFFGEVLSRFPSPCLADMMLSVEDPNHAHPMETIPDNLEVFLVPSGSILDHRPNLLDPIGWDCLVRQRIV